MWFADSPWPTIVALLVATVAFAFAWSRSRRPVIGGLAVACLLLIPAVYFAERAIVTPAEEVEADVLALRDAVVAGDVERTLSFFSATALPERTAVAAALALADVQDDLRITDLDVSTFGVDTQAVSHFRANGTVSSRAFGDHRVATRWEVSWRKEAGDWKLYKIERLNPITGEPIGLLSGD